MGAKEIKKKSKKWKTSAWSHDILCSTCEKYQTWHTKIS
jgi:hypothetical protein